MTVGVGVNLAMQDALDLAESIIARKDQLQISGQNTSAELSEAAQEYEESMYVRAEENANATWMYLGLFFHERGGVAMVEHFERVRAKERAEVEARADALATESQPTAAVAVA